MAGVSGPLLRRRPSDGIRFLVGLTVGGVAAGVFVSLLVHLVGRGLHAALPETPRLVLLAVVCVGLGLADLSDRTPHVMRQVPQVLVRRLPPGFRGVIWGFDLGLLVTTQKAASLVWATIAAVALLDPWLAPPILVGMAVVSGLSVAVLSLRVTPLNFGFGSRRQRLWVRTIRALSGTALLAMAATIATGAGSSW